MHRNVFHFTNSLQDWDGRVRTGLKDPFWEFSWPMRAPHLAVDLASNNPVLEDSCYATFRSCDRIEAPFFGCNFISQSRSLFLANQDFPDLWDCR